MHSIIKAQNEHFDEIWDILHSIFDKEDSYVYDAHTSKEEAYHLWMVLPQHVYVIIIEGRVAGSYILKSNFPGLGSHVANCSYIVNKNFQGRGIGKLLGEHSLQIAKNNGFEAMQFNIVVSTNVAAVTLWKKLGFHIIGTTPKGFKHKSLGFVDTYIMHRFL